MVIEGRVRRGFVAVLMRCFLICGMGFHAYIRLLSNHVTFTHIIGHITSWLMYIAWLRYWGIIWMNQATIWMLTCFISYKNACLSPIRHWYIFQIYSIPFYHLRTKVLIIGWIFWTCVVFCHSNKIFPCRTPLGNKSLISTNGQWQTCPASSAGKSGTWVGVDLFFQ